jgi:hypothetical protein
LTVVPLVREADRQDILAIPQVTRRVQKEGRKRRKRRKGQKGRPERNGEEPIQRAGPLG